MISEQIEYFLEESNSKTDYPKYLYDAAAADELPGQISSILHLKDCILQSTDVPEESIKEC